MKINYSNPMAKVYQYEYAMYLVMTELFHSVISNSAKIKTLKLYFADLVSESKVSGTPNYHKQEEMMDKMKQLVERDVVGKITFPGINKCMAEVRTKKNPDGTHNFIFSDGIYGFSIRLEGVRKGGRLKIVVKNYNTTAVIKKAHDQNEIMTEPVKAA